MRQKHLIDYDKTEFSIIPGHREYVVNRSGTIVKRIAAHCTIRQSELKQTLHYVKNKPKTMLVNGIEYPNAYLYVTLLTVDALDVNGNIYDRSFLQPIGVHRLVGLAFIPNNDPENNIWINHEDGIKIHNLVDNLRWSTISRNIQHAYDTGLKVGSTAPRIGHSDETKVLMSKAKLWINHPKFKGWYIKDGQCFASPTLAAASTGLHPKTIYRDAAARRNGWSFRPA